MKKLQFILFCIFFSTLIVFFVILFRICFAKNELIKLKSFITTLLYAIDVSMLFLEFSSKKVFLFTTLSMAVSLNQYRP